MTADTSAHFSEPGSWWLPNRPDTAASGTLDFHPAGGATLTLRVPGQAAFGTNLLLDLFKPSSRFPLIHGRTFTHEYSLVDCASAGTRVSTSSPGPSQLTLNAEYLYKGAHLEIPDPLFQTADIQFSHAAAWLGATGFRSTPGEKRGAYTVTYAPYDPISIELNATLAIGAHLHPTTIPSGVFAAGRGPLCLDEALTWSIRPVSPQPVAFYLDVANQLQAFFSVATLRLAKPLSISLASPNTTHVLFYPFIYSDAETRPPHPAEFLFTSGDLAESDSPIPTDRLASALRLWFDKAERLKPAMDLYLAASFAPRSFLVTRFLNLCQALESYDVALRNGTFLSRDAFSKIRTELLGTLRQSVARYATSTDSDRAATEAFVESAAVRINFLNGYTLRARLESLVAEHRLALTPLLPSANEIAGEVVQSRNDLIHQEARRVAKVRRSRLLYLSMFAKLLLELSFLKEMGFSDTHIAKRAGDTPYYGPLVGYFRDS